MFEWKEEFNKGIKELHELTIIIEQSIREGGTEGKVAKDNLSRLFNERLIKLISDIRKKDEEALIKRLNSNVEKLNIIIAKAVKDYYSK